MPKIAALVLAAGLSSRMGSNKMLVRINGLTIIEKTIQVLREAPLSGISIILGDSSDAVREVLRDYPVNFVYNPDYRSGMSSSIKCGIKSVLGNKAIDAVLVMLGDMPLIAASTIDRLIEEFRQSRRPIVVPYYNGQRGHPVLFSRAIFAHIMEIRGDNGAREVIEKFPEQVSYVGVNDRGIILDLDTKQDIIDIFNPSPD